VNGSRKKVCPNCGGLMDFVYVDRDWAWRCGNCGWIR